MYAAHSPATAFFTHYTTSLCQPKLKIPAAFVVNFGARGGERCSMERRGEVTTWEVRIAEANGEFFFEEGWINFVEDNNIEERDVLIFSYVEPARVFVQIFGTNRCAKRIRNTPGYPSEIQKRLSRKNPTNNAL
ncbi:B3 domain-containing protein Os03g0120900-like [Salvia hispanica]|uniref:B3 domain-containing protein Os03g0120900-like n=1 Tax=Salvia hispanica TaxID=49212 RepID=UPI0020098CAB|nr:B3 domain-containing protein Os03g0120900-like [Salvia hispanica]